MKKITILFVSTFLIGATELRAQSPAAMRLASHIAQKMKDSLGLNNYQQQQIYTINIDLHNQKMSLRQQYSNPDSIRFHTQRVEGTRDSLYHTIISGNTYTIYLQKKRNLVTSN